MADTIEYPFPTTLTRRERMLFEEHAGITLAQLGAMMADAARHGEITAQIEASLILIAVRRKNPAATIDDVLDHDEWVLAQPAAEAPESPLPSPTAPN